MTVHPVMLLLTSCFEGRHCEDEERGRSNNAKRSTTIEGDVFAIPTQSGEANLRNNHKTNIEGNTSKPPFTNEHFKPAHRLYPLHL